MSACRFRPSPSSRSGTTWKEDDNQMCFWHGNHFAKVQFRNSTDAHEKTRKEMWAIPRDINAIFCRNDGWKNKDVM